MTGDAKIRLRLDARQARDELQGLSSVGSEAASRITGRLTQGAGRLASAFGAGAIGGMAINAVAGSTRSGIGDVIGEAFGGWGAQLERWALGDLAPQARADAAAREETIASFGAIAGRDNKIPPGAKNYFDSIRSLRLEQENGKRLFEESKDFRSTSPDDIIDRIITAVGEALRAAVDYLISKLPLVGNG